MHLASARLSFVHSAARMAIAVGAISASLSASAALAEPAASPAGFVETGVASTYGTGDGFQGQLTACGQVFDTYVPQVAHKSLPCGTMLQVKDLDNGRSVHVVVTDRGPYVPGRIVDLSWAAFKELDPSGPGLLNVEIAALPDGATSGNSSTDVARDRWYEDGTSRPAGA